MKKAPQHAYIPTLNKALGTGKIDRREFVSTATLLGMSAALAYQSAGVISGDRAMPAAAAAMPKGSTLRLGMRVIDVSSPHTPSSTVY